MTLGEKVAYFDREITHDQKAIVWIYRFRKLTKRQINYRDGDIPTYAKQLRFHKQALRWHANLYYRYKQKWIASFTPVEAIRFVFGIYAAQALSVAYCESKYNVWASNGQYLGLFQMGEKERAKYGHSSTAYGQSLAAYGYFSDRGWSPWECKP